MSMIILCASAGMNVKLSETLLETAKNLGGEVELINLVDLNLPLYSTVEEKANGIPDAAKTLSEKLGAAKSFVVVAPEYNGTLPPVLNNAVAWVSRSGDDWRVAFGGKLAAVATHSGGGGQKVLNAMRVQLAHLGCTVIARELLTHYQKQLNPESAEAVLKQLISWSSVIEA